VDLLLSEILSSVIFGLLGIAVMMLSYKAIDWVIPADLNKEIEKGNLAAGVVIAGVFIAIAIIVSTSIR
jgi:uncharacterized membrane protein YjfL (UPF0719 family)